MGDSLDFHPSHFFPPFGSSRPHFSMNEAPPESFVFSLPFYLWQSSMEMQPLLRIKYPWDPPMVVEANVDHDFLDRVRKLMLICEKIHRTMNGPAKVTIDNSHGTYVLLESQAVVSRVMAKAGVKAWRAVQYVVMPDDLLLGTWGACLALAGLPSRTLIDQDGLWFEGTDGRTEYVSVKMDRQGLNKLLALPH
jgi:hypothetical protein